MYIDDQTQEDKEFEEGVKRLWKELFGEEMEPE